MKILWIVNTVLNPLSERLYNKKSNGLWMEALLEGFKEQQEYELVIATTAALKDTVKLIDERVTYYALPSQLPLLYDENKKENTEAWERLLSEEKPDLIQVWGTEFTHGLCALRIATDIPSVIYMQGYLGSIARYYLAGLSEREIKENITFRDVVKKDSILQQQRKYYLSCEKEKEMLQRAGRIISENEWCNSSIRSLVPDIKIFDCPLSVNQVFSQAKWDIEKAEPHSVICNASGYPLKGLHMVLRAVALLNKKYPDIKLYVPGTKMIAEKSLQGWMRKRGYSKYIEKLVCKLGVEENVEWLGNIPQEDLAKYYEKSRVFVLSSAIENHSSSLKEAMMVGTPSVATAVGGVPEYVRHGENGFLYRFEEYEIMASYIARLFEDCNLAINLSKNSRGDMSKLHEKENIYENITQIYHKILNKEKS